MIQLDSIHRAKGLRLDIEVLRLASAFGIVWFHSGAPGQNFAYGGLIVFLLLSTYLAGGSTFNFETVSRRAQRLLVPWLFWCLFYAVANTLMQRQGFRWENGTVAGILTGPSIHLWFMPFIFFFLVTLDLAKAHISRTFVGYASGSLTVLILAATPAWRPWSMTLGAPWAQYAHAAAGAFLGVFLASAWQLPRWFGWTAILLSLASAVMALPLPGMGLPYLVGIPFGILVASKLVIRPAPSWFVQLSSCSLGIYFLHPFFLVLLASALPTRFLVIVGSFLLSAAIVLLIRNAAPRVSRFVV